MHFPPAIFALIFLCLASACDKDPKQPPPAEPVSCAEDPRVRLGLVSEEVCRGAQLFFTETFEGNGRVCASCHPVENNFTIDAEFISGLDESDPLFVASQVPELSTLERPALLAGFGLILENVDDRSDLDSRFTLRSVPHTLSLATSLEPATNDGSTIPPLQRTGWSGDGAPGEGGLRDFATGAVAQHFPKDLSRTPGESFRTPTSDELDALLAFSIDLGRTNELDIETVSLADSEAEAGRVAFLGPGKCNRCHRNAGANNAAGANRNFDTGVERLRIPDVNAADIPGDGGFGGPGSARPNFDCNGDGELDCFGNGTFNSTPLIESADTGPFFHTNAFDTLESAVAFYNSVAFNTAPNGNGIALSGVEISQIGRFLRVLNVALNVQMAKQRLEASREIAGAYGNAFFEIERDLIELSVVEITDAIQVLRRAPQPLHPELEKVLADCRSVTLAQKREDRAPLRIKRLDHQISKLKSVDDALGANIDYVLGAANVMFTRGETRTHIRSYD